MASPSSSVFGDKALWGVSDCGQLMGNRGQPGLTSIEPEGTYEHLAIGVLEEGYTIAYKMPDGSDHVKYDVFEDVSGIVCLNNHICRNDKDEFVKTTESMTDDGLISIRQTFIISKNGTRVVWDRPLYAFRGGFKGAGASSTDSKIAANIERGF